jgi:hypothetical protein
MFGSLHLRIENVNHPARFVGDVGYPSGQKPQKVGWHPKLFPYFVSLVAQQGKTEPVFYGKFFMAFNRLTADANNKRISLLKNLELVAERASLGCTAGRVIFWVEIDNQVFFTEYRIYVEQITVLIFKLEFRDFTSNFYFVHGNDYV